MNELIDKGELNLMLYWKLKYPEKFFEVPVISDKVVSSVHKGLAEPFMCFFILIKMPNFMKGKFEGRDQC